MLRDPIKSNLARAPVPDDYLQVMITYVVMMILFYDDFSCNRDDRRTGCFAPFRLLMKALSILPIRALWNCFNLDLSNCFWFFFIKRLSARASLRTFRAALRFRLSKSNLYTQDFPFSLRVIRNFLPSPHGTGIRVRARPMLINYK